MTITTTKAYRTWRQRLAAPTIEHGSVIQLCRNIYPGTKGAARHGRNTTLEDWECTQLIDQLTARIAEDHGPRATEQNEQRGRDWLNEYARRLGLPPASELRYLDIVEMRLNGFYVYDEVHDRWGYRVEAAPIWRALFPDGTVLRYAPTAWQSSLSGAKQNLWWEVIRP